ncbi:hypothetical protein BDK51DRAFT_37746 [Blyttiomyces helicus]|uniref:Uncharacterized protein n=1 Tax=Blyttiomyces helicus TaxID=388810 RepID=A0A4P9W9D2_9FUNG|nr:hypothetical protein BDK51DRAFT_37746 [Blyttiomyces helicus]|eukprot:RKO88772.1 hypothetical protein BDK51DRAFT_37746 [Blyttiomyces helicus]
MRILPDARPSEDCFQASEGTCPFSGVKARFCLLAALMDLDLAITLLLVTTVVGLHNICTSKGDVTKATEWEVFAKEYMDVNLEESNAAWENLETRPPHQHPSQGELLVLHDLALPHKEMYESVVEELIKRHNHAVDWLVVKVAREATLLCPYGSVVPPSIVKVQGPSGMDEVWSVARNETTSCRIDQHNLGHHQVKEFSTERPSGTSPLRMSVVGLSTGPSSSAARTFNSTINSTLTSLIINDTDSIIEESVVDHSINRKVTSATTIVHASIYSIKDRTLPALPATEPSRRPSATPSTRSSTGQPGSRPTEPSARSSSGTSRSRTSRDTVQLGLEEHHQRRPEHRYQILDQDDRYLDRVRGHNNQRQGCLQPVQQQLDLQSVQQRLVTRMVSEPANDMIKVFLQVSRSSGGSTGAAVIDSQVAARYEHEGPQLTEVGEPAKDLVQGVPNDVSTLLINRFTLQCNSDG